MIEQVHIIKRYSPKELRNDKTVQNKLVNGQYERALAKIKRWCIDFYQKTVLNVKEVSEMTKEMSRKGEKLSFNDEKTFSGENKQIFVEKMRVRERM